MRSLILSLAVILSSCNESIQEESPAKTENEIASEKRHNLEELNRTQAENLIKKYNAQAGWDTVVGYSFTIQELLAKSQPVSLIGNISQVFKKDTTYVLLVGISHLDAFFEITVHPMLFNKLNEELDYYNDKACFIVKVNHTAQCYPTLSSETSGSGEEVSSIPVLDYSLSLLKVKGDLVDFYYYKSIEQ